MNEGKGQGPTDTNVFWTWGGKYVGYRSSDDLFGPDGRQVGSFAEGDEVYGVNGEYVGEVRGGNRLITNLKKQAWTRNRFTPRMLRAAPVQRDVVPKEMLPGYVDFPIAAARAKSTVS